jgi:hypothetical protein
MPPFFRMATEQSFNDASAINTYFSAIIEKALNKAISLYDLIERTVVTHKSTINEGGLLSGRMISSLRKDAQLKIFNKFTGYIYKLQCEKIEDQNGSIEISEDVLNSREEDIHKYFYISALNNETNLKTKLAYILDHKYKETE